MTRKDTKNLDVHASPKAATVLFISKKPYELYDIGNGEIRLVYRFPRTPETEAGLQAYFDDVLLPVKTITDLTRSLQWELMNRKKILEGGSAECDGNE